MIYIHFSGLSNEKTHIIMNALIFFINFVSYELLINSV